MKIRKLLYFGDFIAIPVVVAALAETALAKDGIAAIGPVAANTAIGLLVWTLVEYLVHRFVYHHAPYFAPMHGEHHDHPDALLGFPSFVSTGLIVAAFYFPIRLHSLAAATRLTIGMLIGYALYMFVHHATHHFDIQPGDALYRARVRHLGHHYRPTGNFGVTTGLWDAAFGTAISKGGRIPQA